MTLLRIRVSLAEAPSRCQWALLDNGREPVAGEGALAELPDRAGRIQLVVPAEQVLITRARLPHAARRHTGLVLAYAVEDKTAGEPDANRVSWLGMAGNEDVLAVIDRSGLLRWQEALEAAGIRNYEIHCETLLLPRAAGQWSLAWNGTDGFVRTGEFEGTAVDCGDRETPPLSLRLLLEEATMHESAPESIEIYENGPDAAPDCDAWTRELGIAVHPAGTWDWRTAAPEAGAGLARERNPWRAFSGSAARLRPAAWILGAVLALHGAALVIDWASLANEQRALHQQMDSRFRSVFPDAVAVVDPTLQMRRKLAEARHAAGRTDEGDFLIMIEQVAAAIETSSGTVRAVSYESGRLTLELDAVDAASLDRIVMRLRQSGLIVQTPPGPARDANAAIVLTVRAS